MNDSPTDDLYAAEPETPQVNAPGPKITTDPAPDPAEDREREAAFNSEPPEWNGKLLRPWGSALEGWWLEVRNALGAPHLSRCVLSGYTWLPDAHRILFLCSHDRHAIRHLRADPLAFQEAVDDWADENLQPGDDDQAQFVTMRLYNDAHKNHAESAPPETPAQGDSLGN